MERIKLILVFGFSLMLVGSSHRSRPKPPNQAGMLQALLRGKSHRLSTINTVEWDFGDVGSSEVGHMDIDLMRDGFPGQPSRVKFKQYAGYITVDKSNGRRLFYYFAEVARDPSSKPLLLWLNGGPGCSSLGLGAMLEIGPFGVKPDNKKLYLRHHAWNKVANTLFVESPAGVGFSYSNTQSDYDQSGDTRTAQDSYVFLVNWFKRFPHYKGRDFYIAGDSDASFYIPELADIIIQRSMQNDSSGIKFKGVMIGNGIMNDLTDSRGETDYLWSHALISDQTHKGLLYYCGKEQSNEKDFISKYEDFQEKVGDEAGHIDFYNIYAPTCSKNSNNEEKKKKKKKMMMMMIYGFDPCAEDYIYAYLNLPQVQEALHANKTGLPYPWDFCSGDTDAVVPVTGTRYSVDALNLSVKKPWQPWMDNVGEVGGYRVVYDGLTLATVRGAGHEVRKYQPGRALALFKSFLAWD